MTAPVGTAVGFETVAVAKTAVVGNFVVVRIESVAGIEVAAVAARIGFVAADNLAEGVAGEAVDVVAAAEIVAAEVAAVEVAAGDGAAPRTEMLTSGSPG